MTKFNNQETISNYPNCTCINPKLNSNKAILCFKSGMHQTKAEGRKPISGIMQLVKMQKGIPNGKRHKAKRDNAKRYNAKRHNAKRHNASRHNAKRHNSKRHNAKSHKANRHNTKSHNTKLIENRD